MSVSADKISNLFRIISAAKRTHACSRKKKVSAKKLILRAAAYAQIQKM